MASDINPKAIVDSDATPAVEIRRQLGIVKAEIEALQAGGGVTKAAFVPDVAGANPTAAEFEALRDALVTAGLMEPS